jgi:hypothetical protein
MVDRQAPLFHYFLNAPVALRVRGVSANADEDDVDRETHSFNAEHVR